MPYTDRHGIQGRPGRMRKFSSPEEMEAWFKGYFKECEKMEKPMTMSGFARYCGFKNRSAFLTYEDADPRFQEVFDDIKLAIEEQYEISLTTARNSTGAQFALKNMKDGWNESQDVNLNGRMSVFETLLDDGEEHDQM